MRVINTSINQRRPRVDINHGMRFLVNWIKSGSVASGYWHGRNCVRLTSKKRKARIRYRPTLRETASYRVSVDIFSPIGNGQSGCGTLITHARGWDGAQGAWKKICVPIRHPDMIVIDSTGWEGKHSEGDVCYVDIGSLRIETDH